MKYNLLHVNCIYMTQCVGKMQGYAFAVRKEDWQTQVHAVVAVVGVSAALFGIRGLA